MARGRLPTLPHEERTDRRLCSILSLEREHVMRARYHKYIRRGKWILWARAIDPLTHVPFLGAKELLYD